MSDRAALDEIDGLLDQYIDGRITQLQCIVRISGVIGQNNLGRNSS